MSGQTFPTESSELVQQDYELVLIWPASWETGDYSKHHYAKVQPCPTPKIERTQKDH